MLWLVQQIPTSFSECAATKYNYFKYPAKTKEPTYSTVRLKLDREFEFSFTSRFHMWMWNRIHVLRNGFLKCLCRHGLGRELCFTKWETGFTKWETELTNMWMPVHSAWIGFHKVRNWIHEVPMKTKGYELGFTELETEFTEWEIEFTKCESEFTFLENCNSRKRESEFTCECELPFTSILIRIHIASFNCTVLYM